MTLQHYLPAAYLGGFSDDTTRQRRKRRLFAHDRKTGKTFSAPAEGLGAVNDLYTLRSSGNSAGSKHLVDDIWMRYEAGLADGIEQLCSPQDRLDAITWATVLVPFVVGILLRGPDFTARMRSRISSVEDLISDPENNARWARVMEVQRLLAPVTAAHWTVMHVPEPGAVLENDLAYCIYRPPEFDRFGFAIPLNKRAVLGVVPAKQRTVIRHVNDGWRAEIVHQNLERGWERALNQNIAIAAQRFYFGPTEELVNQFRPQPDAQQSPVDPEQLGFAAGRLALVHEFEWHRLVTALHRGLDDPRFPDFDIDWEAIASRWAPPIILGMNVPEFPPGLSLGSDGTISLNLYEVKGFTL